MNTTTAPPTTAPPMQPVPSRRGGFHSLRVAGLRRPTADTVAVTLEVPEALRAVFAHHPGQHVVVRHRRPGGELRRSYSLCPPPDEPGALRLVIKRGGPGGFGAYATSRLRTGDRLELSAPTGSFTLPELPPGGHHMLLAGGSGITPLAPMAAHALRRDPACRVSLIHSVPTSADALLADELAHLKDEFVDRLTVLHVLTREDRGSADGPLARRLDAAGLRHLLAALGARPGPDTAFALCGPPGLLHSARRALADWGADPALVRWELFTTPSAPRPRREPQPPASGPVPAVGETRVSALLDGRRRVAVVRPGDLSLLDALLRAHPDIPYACREGVCGSCRAKVLSGQVAADAQHALDAGDLAAGYTLVCRARPNTPEVTLDFDA
ncbi:2Fe-2S iron-sulfur cluster-binding protein [Streptomyces sp. NPDC017943]|uniref:2Fe-2S iron-sulfur cluster-binding protein n=1 Tax=Streptomyces sp. NPDC017943 TaxID=3365019 RepID=UPI0037AAC0F1